MSTYRCTSLFHLVAWIDGCAPSVFTCIEKLFIEDVCGSDLLKLEETKVKGIVDCGSVGHDESPLCP